ALSGRENTGAVYRLVGATANTCAPPPPPPKQLAAAIVGIRAVTRRVKRNGRAPISGWVSPCAGRRRQPVPLLRRQGRLGSPAPPPPAPPCRASSAREPRGSPNSPAAPPGQRPSHSPPQKKTPKNPAPPLHTPAGVGRR